VSAAEAAAFLPIWSCSVWGLPCPRHYCRGGALLPHLFTLTSALRQRRYIFCGTFRRVSLNPLSRTLSGTLLCGVRTFLPRRLTQRERPSGPAANSIIILDGERCWQDSILGLGPLPVASAPGESTKPALWSDAVCWSKLLLDWDWRGGEIWPLNKDRTPTAL